MYLKSWSKYILIGLMSGTIIFCLFCPLFSTTSINNETMFLSIVGWKFNDGSIFVALISSIITILVTHYSVNKNYKSIKLSMLSEDSVNLLIDLEFEFNKYHSYTDNEKDEFILLTEILKHWKDYQKALKLLTPKFYTEFLRITQSLLKENTINTDPIEKVQSNKIIAETYQEKNDETKKENEELQTNEHPTKKEDNNKTSNNEKLETKDESSQDIVKKKGNYKEENSKYIFKALVAQITDIAFENTECIFEFICPDLIEDEINVKELGEDLNNYTKIKINHSALKNYITSIKGQSTQESINLKFTDFHDKIKKLVDNLEKEIEEYD